MNRIYYRQQTLNYIHNQRQQGGLWLIWFVILPVVPIFAYAFLGYLRILPSDNIIPRHIYIIVGVTIWLLFSDAIIQPSRSIDRFKQYFIRQEIGLFTLLSAWLPERAIVAALQFTVCLVFALPYSGFDVINIALFIFLVMTGFLLFFSIGIFSSIAILLAPNFRNLIETVNRFLIFLSAVIFPIEDGGQIIHYLKVLNPYYVFIDSSRLALFGINVDWQLVAMWLCVLVFALLFLKIRLNAIAADVRDYLQ